MTIRRHLAPISLRLRFHDDARIGPGKIALLQAIDKHGSVAAAAADMDMSARRAWLLIESLNNAFKKPLVEHHSPADTAQSDPSEAQLTELGALLVSSYRNIEDQTLASVHDQMSAIINQLKQPPDNT